METKKFFERIEINGDERNLPEKDGKYITMLFAQSPELMEFNELLKGQWLFSVEYYFLPVPEPQQPEQPESAELNENQKELIEMYAMILTGFKLTKDEAISELTKCINLIRSHNNTVVGLDSDGDFWFKQFNERHPDEVSEIMESPDYKK